MGLLDWLRGHRSRVEIRPDRIWISDPASYAGIAREVAEALNGRDRPSAVILMAQFPNVLAELQAMLDRSGFEPHVVRCTLAKGWKGLAAGSPDVDDHALIIVAERHPLRSPDEAIVEAAGDSSCRCRIGFHLSLEDPLMRRFAGENTRELLQGLGMSEDESIESAMVSRRLLKSQKKLEARANGDVPAMTAEKWLILNCPD